MANINNNNDALLVIKTFLVKEESLHTFHHKLTAEELDNLEERLTDNIYGFIHEQIEQTIRYYDLLQRNEGAEKRDLYFQVKWRNPNAYADDFKVIANLKSHQDAQAYIDLQSFQPEDEWAIETISK